MAAGNLVSFTGEDAYQAYLGTHQDTGSKLSAMSQTVGLTPDSSISIGNGFFTKIYSGYQATRDFTDGLATEADNIKYAKEQQQEIKVQQQENEKKAEEQRDGVSAATANFKEYKEAQEQKMFEMYGKQFSAEAMQEVASDALSDFERLAREKGWTEEQQETISDALLVLKDPKSSTEDVQRAHEKIRKADPEYSKEIVNEMIERDNVRNAHLDNQNKSTQEATKIDVESGLEKTKDNFDLDSLLSEAESSPLVQESYAEAMDTIENSEIRQSSQQPQKTAEINEVVPAIPKGMTLG